MNLDDYNVLASLAAEMYDKKVIIFGTGSCGKNVFYFLKQNSFKTDYFIDNNQKKWDESLFGTKIFSPEILLNEKKDSIFILIASFYDEEIKNQLESMGFENEKHFAKVVVGKEARIKQELINYFSSYHSLTYSPLEKLKEKALSETVEYISKNMKSAMMFQLQSDTDRLKLINYALKNISIDGLILEFGIFEGTSVNFIAKTISDNIIYGFDSFEGLPEDWSGYDIPKERFLLENLPKVEPNVKLIKGWFNDTLPTFVNDNKDKKISFLHIDCDIYSSTKTIFNYLAKMIAPGTVILFDEYYNYPNWQEHEYKAFKEFCKKYKIKYRYIAAGTHQVAVVIEQINHRPFLIF